MLRPRGAGDSNRCRRVTSAPRTTFYIRPCPAPVSRCPGQSATAGTWAVGPRPRPLPESVDVAAFAEWLGWYLAEGSVSGDRLIRFSLGAHELAWAERLRELTASVFPASEFRMATIGSKLELWFCHALLARWLKHECGAGARNKRLPRFVWWWTRMSNGDSFALSCRGTGPSALSSSR